MAASPRPSVLNRFKFQDANAIVTGATGGIGLAIVERLIQRGTRVIAVGRRQQRLQSMATRMGESLIPVAVDLSDPNSIDVIAEQAKTHFGERLDLLVNNAGVGAIGPFAEADSERLRTLFEVDFFAAVELSRRLMPMLVAGSPSTLCNIGSVLGHCAVPDKAEYCAAKFALHGWSDALRSEWRRYGITVTLVSPSTTRSEFFDSLVGSDGDVESRSIGSWSTDQVGDAAIRAIERRRREMILSLGGKLLVYADRFVPDIVSRFLARQN